jgi:hypothetical protein
MGVASISLNESFRSASTRLNAVYSILGTISFILERQRLHEWMAISFTALKLSTKTALSCSSLNLDISCSSLRHLSIHSRIMKKSEDERLGMRASCDWLRKYWATKGAKEVLKS